jgi:hypothetical protein
VRAVCQGHTCVLLLVLLLPPAARASAAAPAAAAAALLPPLLPARCGPAAAAAGRPAACRAAAALLGLASWALGLDLLRVGVRLGLLPDSMKSNMCEMTVCSMHRRTASTAHGM